MEKIEFCERYENLQKKRKIIGYENIGGKFKEEFEYRDKKFSTYVRKNKKDDLIALIKDVYDNKVVVSGGEVKDKNLGDVYLIMVHGY